MIKNLFLLTVTVFLFQTASSQVTNLGEPTGWNTKIKTKPISFETMGGFDLNAIKAEDEINDIQKTSPWRFGYKYSTNYNLSNSGQWTTLKNGRLWQIGIECPSALTINLLLDNLYLPEGATLFLYDNNKTNYVGAYTSLNNRDDGELGTELVHGSSIILEYFEPNEVAGQGSLTITDVVHGYRSLDIIQSDLTKALNSSGDCNIDVLCPLGIGWENQTRAVAMIVVSGSGICTGALVNNTNNDGTPYFLTANHCLGGSTGSWAFRFNWKSPVAVCASPSASQDPGPPYDETANGATVLVNGTEADHALLQIDNLTLPLAQSWNLYYAGWNNNDLDDPANVLNATGIHHPKGDVMKICREDNAPYHSVELGAEVWYINQWEQGVTEPGSSGSPLFDQNGLIIGQLYGGAAACNGTSNNGQYDYYGRLGISWDLGICDFLAPGQCSIETQVGWDPNGVASPDNAAVQSIFSPFGTICGDAFTPQFRLYNLGSNDLTSCTITYDIDGGTPVVYNWTGLISPNQYEDVSLPSMTATNGAHTFNLVTSDPNAVVDTDPSNDSGSSNFELILGGQMISTHVFTDCWGAETYWEVTDVNSNIVGFGGNESGIPPGGGQTAGGNDPGAYNGSTLYTEDLCLAIGCYDFTIYDDWGDGMNGSTQPNCNDDGYYALLDANGDTLISILSPDFGNSEIQNFCVNYLGLDKVVEVDVLVYPNPANDILFVELPTAYSNVKYIISDVSGRLIKTGILHSETSKINIAELQSGNYFISLEIGDEKSIQKIAIQ